MNSRPTLLGNMPKQARSPAEKKADLALGRRLATIRKERGLTQVQLAERIDTKQTSVSDYECGRIRPNPSMLVRLSKALDVSTDELLGLKKPTERPPTISRRLLRRIQAMQKLPKRDLDALLRTIDVFIEHRKAG